MTPTRWTVGSEPLTIFNTACGVSHKFAKLLLDRATLVYVDIRYVPGSGSITYDTAGYLPHLEYTPDYQQTEEDRGVDTLTGNVPVKPTWRFDPAPFYSDCTGKCVLVGGAGGAQVDVSIVFKRYSKIKQLRQTLTIATQIGRFSKPFGCSGMWLPEDNKGATFFLGGATAQISQPNGALFGVGAFEHMTFAGPQNSAVTFEVVLPL